MNEKDKLSEQLTVQVEPAVVDALRQHQRAVQQQTGMRTSMSAIAASLLRQGLQRSQPTT